MENKRLFSGLRFQATATVRLRNNRQVLFYTAFLYYMPFLQPKLANQNQGKK